MVNILNNVEKLDLSIEEIDNLTGPIIGSQNQQHLEQVMWLDSIQQLM